MMLSMLSANARELFLNSLMTDVIRADLSSLHRQKLKTLVRQSFEWVQFLMSMFVPLIVHMLQIQTETVRVQERRCGKENGFGIHRGRDWRKHVSSIQPPPALAVRRRALPAAATAACATSKR